MIERIMIFIDGSNLYYGCQRFEKGFKLDYIKLKEILSNGRKLIRPYYYGSISPSTQIANNQTQFHVFLQRNGYDVKVLPLRKRRDSFIEKGADVALVTDMLIMAFNDYCDIIILVSGDDDFVKAVEEVKRCGKRVEVVYFEKQVGSRLRNCADYFIPLDKYMENLRQVGKSK